MNNNKFFLLFSFSAVLVGGCGGDSTGEPVRTYTVSCWDGSSQTSRVSGTDYTVCPAKTAKPPPVYTVSCWDGSSQTSRISETDYTGCPAITGVSVELQIPDAVIIRVPEGLLPVSGNLAIGKNGTVAKVIVSSKTRYYASDTCDKTLFNSATAQPVTGIINFNRAPPITVNATVTPNAAETVKTTFPDNLKFYGNGTSENLITVTGARVNSGLNFGDFCDTVVQQAGGTCSQRVFACQVAKFGSNIPVQTQLAGQTLTTSTVSVNTYPQVTFSVSATSPVIARDMVVELYPDKAPITVKNFLKYVNAGFYKDTVFHRVVPSLNIAQGGGYIYNPATPAYVSKTALYPAITMEAPGKTGLKNLINTISMARTSDQNSATSQFFFNSADNPGFDSDTNPYAVFGQLVTDTGKGALATMVTAPTNAGNVTGTLPAGSPVSPITIIDAKQTR